MNFAPNFFLHAAYVLFLLHSLSSDFCFLLSGPTPIHAPRPRPITYSIAIGTNDSVDVSTQGGPPQPELSSFLQDLAVNATSSPVARAPVSVLSPNFQRYLDGEFAARSPPPPRVTVCHGTSTRDEVQQVDVAINTVCISADVAVQAVVETSDSSTVHDPPVESPPVASSLIADVLSMVEPVVDHPDLPSASGTETGVEIPEDFSFSGSPSVGPDPGDVVPAPDTGLGETSPLGPSLIDSDDEPIASRLPGYLNSFKTCEVSDQYLHSFIFLFSFLLAIQIFRLFHLFSIVLVLFAVQFCMLCFSSFSHR